MKQQRSSSHRSGDPVGSSVTSPFSVDHQISVRCTTGRGAISVSRPNSSNVQCAGRTDSERGRQQRPYPPASVLSALVERERFGQTT